MVLSKMKTKLLSLLAVCLSGFAFAQPCIPDTTIKKQGIYPDSATNLPKGYLNMAYNTVLQVRVLTDTVVNGLQAKVDSIRVTGVTGFPPSGFQYQCDIPNCTWKGGTNGCVLITGNPAAVGTFPLKVKLIAYGKISGFPASLPDSIEYYKIVVDSAVGISPLARYAFQLNSVSFLRASDQLEVSLESGMQGRVRVSVHDILGKEKLVQVISCQPGMNRFTLDLDGLSPGIYLFSADNGERRLARKIAVN